MQSETLALLFDRLDYWTQRIVSETTVRDLSARCDVPVERARLLVETYTNEARVGLQLIGEAPPTPGARILEVGSGIGLVSRLLAEHGYDVVGLEPAAPGFSFMRAMGDIVAEHMPADGRFKCLPISVTDLDTHTHGLFDLVFSVNVIEHLPSLEQAVESMKRVLARDGAMVHMCPNYAFPYEPHFNIPLVPVFPRLTRFVFPKRTQIYPGLWNELNFVTANRLRKIARTNDLTIAFDNAVMGGMARRLLSDPVLAARQGGGARSLALLLNKLGAFALVDSLPADLTSPMVARLRPRNEGARAN